MSKSLHFDFHDVDKSAVVCEFYAVKDGIVWPGQAQIVPKHQWQTYRAYLEAGGWTYRRHQYCQGRA